MAKDEWKLIGPEEMVLTQYACGVTAGESVRLRRDIVVRDSKDRLIGDVYKAGEVWTVLKGNSAEPEIVWLRQPDGHPHTWTNTDLLEWFEPLSSDWND